jgi:hypothetical protein
LAYLYWVFGDLRGLYVGNNGYLALWWTDKLWGNNNHWANSYNSWLWSRSALACFVGLDSNSNVFSYLCNNLEKKVNFLILGFLFSTFTVEVVYE